MQVTGYPMLSAAVSSSVEWDDNGAFISGLQCDVIQSLLDCGWLRAGVQGMLIIPVHWCWNGKGWQENFHWQAFYSFLKNGQSSIEIDGELR
jgi:hypothetical protein